MLCQCKIQKYNCKLLKLHCVISAQEVYKLKVCKRLDNKLFRCAMINNNCALEINILLFDSGRCWTLQMNNLYLMFYSKYKLIRTVLSQFQKCMVSSFTSW